MSMKTQRWLSALAAVGFLIGIGPTVARGIVPCPFPPGWSAEATADPSEVCTNQDVNLSATHTCNCPISTNITYQWDSGSKKQSFTTKYGTAGITSETVTVTITSSNGTPYSETGTVYITVVNVDSISFKDNPVAPGTTTTATATTTPAGRKVNWSIISSYGVCTDAPAPTASIDTNGVITVPADSPLGTITVRAADAEVDCAFFDAVLSIDCTCSDCSAGTDDDTVCSINSRILLGRKQGGQTAGRLRLRAESMSPAVATPAALSYEGNRGDVEVIEFPDQASGLNVLRQVLAPECLADIVVSNEFKYSVNFYERSAVGAKDTNGLYQVSGGAAPFVSFIFENPAASTNDLHLFRKTKIGQGPAVVTEYEYALEAGLPQWTLRQGNGLRAQIASTVTNAAGKVVTRRTLDAAGQVVSKTRLTYRNFDWGRELVEQVIDPDGAALTTTREYYDDTIHPGQYSKLRQVVNADGSWKRYDYDEEGRKTLEVSSWINAGTNASANDARAVYYSYEPVYQYYLTTNIIVTNGVTNAVVVTNAADSGVLYAALPRITTEKILGQVVRKTFNAYYELETGGRVEIEERAAEASASYGEPSNLRTVRTYYPVASGEPDSGKLKSALFPDGRRESFYYEKGDYAGGIFSLGTGDYERVTAVQGTESSPDGISLKTTASRTVSDPLGRTVLEETQVYANGNYERLAWTTYTYDSLGHLIRVDKSNGTYSEAAWACCGKESEKDESGIEHIYAYDALKRLVFSKKVGISAGAYPAQPDQITTYTYDAEGRQLTEVLSAGGLSQSQTNQYDLAGRQTESTDFAGRRTTTTYSQDGLTTTETLPGGFTRITERFKDGQVKTITGTAQVPRFYEYGVNADGTRWTKVSTATANSPVWVKTTTDLFGRPVKTEKPGYSTTEVTENFYNSKNQLVKTTTTGKPDTLNAYDELGNQIRSGLDVNGNGSLDLAGTDRISESDSSYMSDASGWWLENVSRLYAVDNSAETITNSITRQRLTGLGGAGPELVERVVSVRDVLGNETITTTTIDRDTKKVTQTTDVPDSSANIVSISVNGLLQSSTTAHSLQPTVYSYDSLGRQTSALQGGPGAPRTVGTYTHFDSHGSVDYTEDAAGNRTTFTYDPATGRRLSQFNALTGSTYWAYTAQGLEEKKWGSADYPVLFEYDSYNRRVKQHTFRDGAGWAGPSWPVSPGDSDETTWTYHEATGLLLSKTDDAGKSVSYTYDSANRPATRIWSRVAAVPSNGTPLVTSYSYSPAGDLIGLDYSDSTPDVSFTYDRLGRQKTAESSVSSHKFGYNGLLLDSETIASSTGTNVIDRSYDSYGRSTGFTMGNDYSVSYAYDSFGRFSSVTSSLASFACLAGYSYLPNSDLIQQSIVNGLQSTRSYEDHRNLLTKIKNSLGSETISQYSYANDALGRRISAGWSGSAFGEMGPTVMKYGYNTRSEVISAERFFDTDPTSVPVAGQNWDYDFDPIGNRKTAARDGDTEVYTANNLNQYTERTVPGVAQVAGTAAEDATVTINRPTISGITVEPVTRQGAYFHKKLSLDNSAGADVEEIAVVGVLAPHSLGDGGDIVSTYSGVVWTAQSPERFSYDDDGNTLSDAVRSYEWDAENRLIAVTVSNVVDGSLKRVEFSYDYMSRRSMKKVFQWVNGQWSMVSRSSFLYDGWNLISEVCAATGKGTITDYYVWGLDLSGSLQGAGGIGGLIGRVRSENRYYDEQGMLLICHKPPGNPENEQTLRINESAWPAHQAHGDSLGACAGASVSNTAFLYTYDGNGNVSELLQPTAYSPQSIVGHYEYSPFGELIVSTGPEAEDNPIRFSTKYFVDELGIGDWGRRWYLPPLGRWLARDPIGEKELGEKNLYAFVGNRPADRVDELGLMSNQDIDAEQERLNNLLSQVSCCCTNQGLSIPDFDVFGVAVGNNVILTSIFTPHGCVQRDYKYYWWDCFAAQHERNPYLYSDWKNYGWSAGGSSYSRTENGGGFWGIDTSHWAFQGLVLYTLCGADGRGHAFLAPSSPGELDWTWNRATFTWEEGYR